MAKQLSLLTYDPNRIHMINKTATLAAGVYVNKLKTIHNKPLQKTVFINVFETANEAFSGKYRELVHNFLCYNNQLEYEVILYILDRNITRLQQEVQTFYLINNHIKILEYPYSLFWEYISHKNTTIEFRSGNVGYQNNYPTFQDFGFLVVLIPILELLELGYNVLYLDVDIVLLKDILPEITRGKSDLSLSAEMRTCSSQSLPENYNRVAWDSIEPNTGTMYWRSNQKSIHLFKLWIDNIIQNNANNDQKRLTLKKFGAIQSFDCNGLTERMYPSTASDDNLTYCFLNEWLFQNGKLALNCAFNKHGMRSEYMLALAALRYQGTGQTMKEKLPFIDIVTEIPRILDDLKDAPGNKLLITPLTVHVNYCDNKQGELETLGLWLGNDTSKKHEIIHQNNNLSSLLPSLSSSSSLMLCKSLKLENSYYGMIDWKKEILIAKKDVEECRSLPNNTVYAMNRNFVYLLMNNTTRVFYYKENLLKYGYQWNQLKKINPFSYFFNYTVGEPLF
eukprot:gene17391-24033_t